MSKTKNSTIGFIFGTAALSLLAGCVGYVDGPRGQVYVPAPAVYVEEGVSVQDDYVYYPAYRVYYSSYRHQYVYQEDVPGCRDRRLRTFQLTCCFHRPR